MTTYKKLQKEMKILLERARTKLAKMNKFFVNLVSRDALFPEGSKKAFTRSVHSVITNLGYKKTIARNMDEDYIIQLCGNLLESPVHQLVLDEYHWIMFMKLLLHYNSSELEYDLRKRLDSMRELSAERETSPGTKLICKLQLGSAEECDGYLEWIDQKRQWDYWLPGSVIFEASGATRIEFEHALAVHKKLTRWFPEKKNIAASNKSNLYLDDLLWGLEYEDKRYFELIKHDIPDLIGLANDQVCCIIMWHYALWCQAHVYPLRELAMLIFNHDLSKTLSDLVKQIGVAANSFLNCYVEMEALKGRDTVPMDVEQEMFKFSGHPPKGEDVRFEPGVIYGLVQELMAEAMPEIARVPQSERYRLFYPSEETYWKNRLMECVNGAHHLPSECEIPDVAMKGVKTRMMFLEATADNFMYKTRPILEATLSEKNEVVKNRPLKASDTISYVNEDYVMKVIEAHWSHPSALLKPGLSTHVAEGLRVANLAGNEYVCLDFKGMENQHSQQTRLEVIKARNDFMGLPTHISKWLEEMECNQYLRKGDKRIKTTYALMTGRRTTTFINTVLARCYVKHGAGEHWSLVKGSLFAGDDVALRFDTRTDARKCLHALLKSRNTYNIHKQAWGPGCEFLRQSVCGHRMFGYLCRSIASFVNGSWVNKIRLAETDLPSVYQRYAWTLDNRAMLTNYAKNTISKSLASRTGLAYSLCRNICSNTVVVNGGPCRGVEHVVMAVMPVTRLDLDPLPPDAPGHATDDYVEGLEKAFFDLVDKRTMNRVRKIFKTASYIKHNLKGYEPQGMRHRYYNLVPLTKVFDPRSLESIPSGILASHPILPTLRGMLTHTQLEDLVLALTGEQYKGLLPISEWLFGPAPNIVRSCLGNNYDDLMQISKFKFFHGSSNMPSVTMDFECYY